MSFLTEIAKVASITEKTTEGVIIIMEDRIKQINDLILSVEGETIVYMIDGTSMPKDEYVTAQQAEIARWQAVLDILKQ